MCNATKSSVAKDSKGPWLCPGSKPYKQEWASAVTPVGIAPVTNIRRKSQTIFQLLHELSLII